MRLKITPLRKQDQKQAIQFAITGMHFDWYMDSNILLQLYGRYFWYQELLRATQVIAIYADHAFAGVLLAEIRGEPKKYRSFGKYLYVKIFDFLQKVFTKNGVGAYDNANKELLSQYRQHHTPDGEIIFLAANPRIKAKGIGSALLKELERREKGKLLFLYTDSGCTYQFYEHRGFERAGEKDIVLQLMNKNVKLKCFLYSKRLAV